MMHQWRRVKCIHLRDGEAVPGKCLATISELKIGRLRHLCQLCRVACTISRLFQLRAQIAAMISDSSLADADAVTDAIAYILLNFLEFSGVRATKVHRIRELQRREIEVIKDYARFTIAASKNIRVALQRDIQRKKNGSEESGCRIYDGNSRTANPGSTISRSRAEILSATSTKKHTCSKDVQRTSRGYFTSAGCPLDIF